MNTNRYRTQDHLRVLILVALAAGLSAASTAQTTVPERRTDEESREVVQLSPFEVVVDQDRGYAATSSLAGSRLNMALRDVASAVSVVTPEFLKDTDATNLQRVLVYQTNTEVAGIGGNFYGTNADDAGYRNQMLVRPQTGTRVRGLNTADLTRDFFTTSLPMDAYNTSRVDIQRGSNSILFGLGSPAGIINTSLKDPMLQKLAVEAQFRFGSYNSHREVLDVNVPLVKNKLGLRIVGLNDEEEFRQDFTYDRDRRLYGAARWQPVLAEHVYTQLDVKAETGRIKANRPVPTTASDFISNWFDPLNRYLTYDPITSNGIPQDPNRVQHPELSHYFAGAPARDWWNSSPATIWQDPAANTIGNGRLEAYRQRDGTPWGGLSGVTNPNLDEGGEGVWNKNTPAYYANNPMVAGIIDEYQRSTGRSFSGFGASLWPTQMILSGPLAFIDRTIQGPNKEEWNNFDSLDLGFTQTYLDGRLGFNAGYYRESFRSGFNSAIYTDRVTVDVNATLRDGSPNPDVGRPAIIAPSAGQTDQEKREAYRGTLFYKFNLADYLGKQNLLSRIIGEQVFTGVMSSQRYKNFNRSYNLYAWDANSYGIPFLGSSNYQGWWGIHYIGDSLINVPTFSGIPGSAIRPVTSSRSPGASNNALVWDNNTSTWHTANVAITNWRDSLNHLYTGTSEGFDDTKSKSFVWQGSLFNDAVKPLFGWRKDHYQRWDKPSALIRDQYNTPDPFSPEWTYNGTTPLTAEEQRRSWGWVVHTAPILELFHTRLPKGIDLSFTYNESNSFRPSDVGVDVNGRPLAAPSGTTRDKGFVISALDNKVSLRMNWYTTIQKNTTLSDPSGMLYWVKAGVARTMNALAQETWGASTRNQTTPEWLVNEWFFGDGYDKAVADQPLPANWQSMDQAALLAQPLRVRRAAVPGSPTYIAQGTINPDTNLPYLSPLLDEDEMAYRRAWFGARTDAQWFRPLDAGWVQAMQFQKISGDDYRIWGENTPAGHKLTNDLVSKGVEIELTANPTPNWRLVLNAARATAVRANILSDWSDFIAKNRDLWFEGYNDRPVSELNYWTINGLADIRHWQGDTTYSSEQDTFGGRMMQNVYGPYNNAIAAAGKSVNELREWHWNLVTNYAIDRGFLKGVNFGGAVRWQDKAAIGYYPRFNAEANIWVTDVDKPIYAPSETNYDFWIGYQRKLTRRISWQIQLNIHEPFAKDDLIPIQANPDGTVAQVRIPAETTWAITNTFSF